MNFYLIFGIITAIFAVMFSLHIYLKRLETNMYFTKFDRGISKYSLLIKDLKSFVVFMICIGISLVVPFVIAFLKDWYENS